MFRIGYFDLCGYFVSECGCREDFVHVSFIVKYTSMGQLVITFCYDMFLSILLHQTTRDGKPVCRHYVGFVMRNHVYKNILLSKRICAVVFTVYISPRTDGDINDKLIILKVTFRHRFVTRWVASRETDVHKCILTFIRLSPGCVLELRSALMDFNIPWKIPSN